MAKTLFDIGCTNLDLYFDREIQKMTIESKEKLPKDVAFKLFRNGGAWDSKSTSKLGFLAKLFVFLRALKKGSFVIIEDEDTGIGLEQFLNLHKSIKQRDYSAQAAENGLMTIPMVLGNKELMNAFQYLNNLSTSPAMNYLLKAKNVPQNKADQSDKEITYIAKFITFWEGNKKTAVATTGLNIPEIYTLLFLYSGSEMAGKDIYQDKFKRAYQSNPSKIRMAFVTLNKKGYITKYGGTKGLKLQITPSGKAILRDILTKYAINC